MRKKQNREVYRIYKKVIYNGEYRNIAQKHIQSADALQNISDSFSGEQWQAIQDYQAAMMELCGLMVKLALKKRNL